MVSRKHVHHAVPERLFVAKPSADKVSLDLVMCILSNNNAWSLHAQKMVQVFVLTLVTAALLQLYDY